MGSAPGLHTHSPWPAGAPLDTQEDPAAGGAAREGASGHDRPGGGGLCRAPRRPLRRFPPPRPLPAATHGLLLLIVSNRLLSSRTLECSPAAAMSRTWSITFILPGRTEDASGGAEGREATLGAGSKMAAAPGSFGSARGPAPWRR